MTGPVARYILISIGIGAAGVAVHMGAAFLLRTYVQAVLDPWHVLVVGLIAVPVYSLTPKPNIALVVAILAALPTAIVPYLDGDDACDGEPSCEDNFGPVLRFVLGSLIYGFPAVIGEVAGKHVRPRLWHRRRPPDAAEVPPQARLDRGDASTGPRGPRSPR